MAFLDPLLIGAVDLAYTRWHADGLLHLLSWRDSCCAAKNTLVIGDMFKLYWHFYRTDRNGLPGVFLTVFIYAVVMFTGAGAMR